MLVRWCRWCWSIRAMVYNLKYKIQKYKDFSYKCYGVAVWYQMWKVDTKSLQSNFTHCIAYHEGSSLSNYSQSMLCYGRLNFCKLVETRRVNKLQHLHKLSWCMVCFIDKFILKYIVALKGKYHVVMLHIYNLKAWFSSHSIIFFSVKLLL